MGDYIAVREAVIAASKTTGLLREVMVLRSKFQGLCIGETDPRCLTFEKCMSAGKCTLDLPCPFCGGTVDPEGWLSAEEDPATGDALRRGPECNDCGATARTMADWNRRTPA